jgi:hypothetical protein
VAMCNEVVGIGHPVTLDVGSARMIWVRPPVVALGEVVVLAAGAALGVICSYGDGTLANVLAGGAQDSVSVNLGNVNPGSLCGGKSTPRECSPCQAARSGDTELPARTSQNDSKGP